MHKLIKYLSTGAWLNKLLYIYVMEYYLDVNKQTQKTKLLLLINPKCLTLSESSQTQNTT